MDIIDKHEAALAAYIGQLDPHRKLDDREFDAIAKYAVVADELSAEPFMSDDNRDSLGEGPGGTMGAHFGHPAFLKSALLPFRKLWLPSEPCYFEVVRDIVFDVFGERQRPKSFSTPQVNAWRSIFHERHVRSLDEILDDKLKSSKVRNVRDLLDLWIYTQGVHTGKSKGKGRFDLKDFDEVLTKSGRARLEGSFRTFLHLVGHNSYLYFNRLLVRPAFARLLALGYKPNFETHAALKFGPYPKQTDHIALNDPFWHLDKESEEETFDRFIKRWRFRDIGSFFKGYFRDRAPALVAFKKYNSFDLMLSETGAVILDAPSSVHAITGNFSARGDMNHNGGRVHVYANKTVHFSDRSRDFMNDNYILLRKAYLDHRKTIPERETIYWNTDWWM